MCVSPWRGHKDEREIIINEYMSMRRVGRLMIRPTYEARAIEFGRRWAVVEAVFSANLGERRSCGKWARSTYFGIAQRGAVECRARPCVEEIARTRDAHSWRRRLHKRQLIRVTLIAKGDGDMDCRLIGGDRHAVRLQPCNGRITDGHYRIVQAQTRIEERPHEDEVACGEGRRHARVEGFNNTSL